MADTQTFANQDPAVQNMFNTAFGTNAAANWTAQHNAQMAAQSGSPTTTPPVPGVDPNLAANNALTAQQQASMSWANLLGYYDPSAPQNIPANQLTLNAMQDLGFLTLPGQTPGMPSTTEQGITGQYFDPTSGQWKNTLAAGEAVGNVNGTPTLASSAQQANLTGMYNGAPTASQLALAGYVQGPNGQLMPTAQSQQTFLSAINSLLSNNNSATPFTYLAQQRGVANALSPLSSFLQGGIYGATGQTQQQLAGQQNQTVSNVASGITANGGDTANSFIPQMLNYLYNSVPSHAVTGVALPGAGSGHVPGAPLTPYSTGVGATTAMGGGTPFAATALPTGFGTSQQQLNQLSPTAQSAYTNLIQTAGGESPTDFAAGVKAAAPTFAKAGSGTIASMGTL